MKSLPLFLALLCGCAGAPSPSQPSQNVLDWYDAQTTRWVSSVTSSCGETREKYRKGLSIVDCDYDYPSSLRMSFPDRGFVLKHREAIVQYVVSWCRSVEAREGFSTRFTLTTRADQLQQNFPCRGDWTPVAH